ncbi:MAG: hypothetical protein K9L62_02005 [Vallitaleaceae bacterium]|nr:hypothetical protein [Vallitaleaceae bacterium]
MDYESNSKARAKKPLSERPRVEPVTVATRAKKKSKFSQIFLAEDVDNVKSYIVLDVLIPAIRKAIYDVITEGASAFLGTSTANKKSTTASKISYRQYYEQDDRPRQVDNSRRYSYDEVEVNTRGEAEDILASMTDLVNRYGCVSVLDLYDLANISSNNYTDENYGWMSMRNSDVVRMSNGKFRLKLPKAMPLN